MSRRITKLHILCAECVDSVVNLSETLSRKSGTSESSAFNDDFSRIRIKVYYTLTMVRNESPLFLDSGESANVFTDAFRLGTKNP